VFNRVPIKPFVSYTDFMTGWRSTFIKNRVAMYLFMHDESNNTALAMYHLVKFKRTWEITSVELHAQKFNTQIKSRQVYTFSGLFY